MFELPRIDSNFLINSLIKGIDVFPSYSFSIVQNYRVESLNYVF